MNWQTKVRVLFNSGVISVEAIQGELIAPRFRIDKTPTATPRTAEQKEFLRLAVAAGLGNRQEIRASENPGAFVLRKIVAKYTAAATSNEKTTVLREVAPVQFQFELLRQLGQEVAPDDADVAGETEQRIILPSWWEENYPGETPPSLQEIRQVLREKQRREEP